MATTEPSEQAKQEAERRRAALAVGAASVAPPAGGAAAGLAIPAAAVRAQAAAVVLAGLVAFLARQRQGAQTWLEAQLTVRSSSSGPAGPVTKDDVQQVIADEVLRDDVFARRQSERIARDTASALSLADPAIREEQMQKIMLREKRYAQQRQEAMAARAFAAIDRVRLRHESPLGAYWALGSAREHTKGCLALHALGFLPWEVLNRVFPPRHPGCTAYLIGYGDAIKQGLMAPGDVLPVRDAIRAAQGVVMESDERLADALDEELRRMELRDALVAAGLTTPERFDAATG